MEVKKSGSNTKKDDESFKGISLVFSKTIQKGPRLSSSATTWAAEEIKMKCIFNKGIAFSSNDTIRRNLSTEIKIPDHKSPSNTILPRTFDGIDQNPEQTQIVTKSEEISKTQFAADIYSLVKSSSNMLIVEEMKANEKIYNLHLGTIYSQATDVCNLADKSIILNNIIEIPKYNIDKPETVHSKENQDTIYDRNIFKDPTKMSLDAGQEIIEMEDIKNRILTADLGPGVLTVALLDGGLSNKSIEYDELTDRESVIEEAHSTFPNETNVVNERKDSIVAPTAVNLTDEFNFSNSIISAKCDTVGGMEYVTSKTTPPYEDFSEMSLHRLFSRKIPKALSVIQESGYSDANFSESVVQSLSDTKLDMTKSDSLHLISSDSAVNKTLYTIKFEPEAGTSAYKRIFKSLVYSSEDDTLITLEHNNIAEKDKQSISIDKLKIGEPVDQNNEDNNFQCEPF